MYKINFLLGGMMSSLILSIGTVALSSQTIEQKMAQIDECNQQQILTAPNCVSKETDTATNLTAPTNSQKPSESEFITEYEQEQNFLKACKKHRKNSMKKPVKKPMKKPVKKPPSKSKDLLW
jgi:hypothetical protein